MDYNDYAHIYRKSRFAVDWVLDPIVKDISQITPNANVLEIGCGTGNYIIAASETMPANNYFGFDLSDKMIEQAKLRNSNVKFITGNCEKSFPYYSEQYDYVFCVDVIHHIISLDNFFSECWRTLKNEGSLVIVTDSEENMRKRSLTKFFPETLQIELDRYPSLDTLHESADKNKFKLSQKQLAEGEIDLNSGYLDKLEAKCSSAVRLLKEDEFQKGIERVRKSAANGEKWFSSYSVIKYIKANKI